MRQPYADRAIALDYESDISGKSQEAKDPRVAIPILISVSIKVGRKYHTTTFEWNDETRQFVWDLSQLNAPLVTYYSYYDILLSMWRGAMPNHINEIKATLVDCRILNWLVSKDVDDKATLGLKEQALKHLGIVMASFKETTKGPLQKSIKKNEKLMEKSLKEYQKLQIRYKKQFEKASVKHEELTVKKKTQTKALAEKVRAERSTKQAIKSLRSTGAKLVASIEKVKAIKEDILNVEDEFPNKIDRLTRIIKLQKSAEHKRFLKYARADARNTLKLYYNAIKILKTKPYRKVYKWFSFERTVEDVTLQMARWGITIDVPYLETLKRDAIKIRDEMEQRVYTIAGTKDPFTHKIKPREFNINSNVEAPAVIWKEIKVPWPSDVEVNANGMPGVNEKTLSRITHPIGQAILDYKAISKLISTYLENIPLATKFCPDDEVRANVITNSTGAAKTGRMSSVGFAMTPGQFQNISSRVKIGYHKDVAHKGKLIRKAFIPREGYALIVADLSQIELRLIAHLTKDPTMLRVYKTMTEFGGLLFPTGDIHAETAKGMNVSRKLAKNLNFGLAYGMMFATFAKNAKLMVEPKDIKVYNYKVLKFIANYFPQISERENLIAIGTDESMLDTVYERYHGEGAKVPYYDRIRMKMVVEEDHAYDLFLAEELVEKFQAKYCGIYAYHRKLGKQWKKRMKHERVWETMVGRKKWFRDYVSPGKLFNGLIQGSAADLLKVQMVTYWEKMLPKMPNAKLLMQIHDELVLEVPIEQAKECAILVKYIMEYPFIDCDVPISSGVKICKTWYDKDDDEVADFGLTYYKTKDGKQHIISQDEWQQFYEADEVRKEVVEKSSVGVLSKEDYEFARDFLGPISIKFGGGSNTTFIPADSAAYKERMNQ